MYPSSANALFSFIIPSPLLSILGFISSHALPPHEVCSQIQHNITSLSAVYYPNDTKYDQAISHYSLGSTQRSACVVEPGNEDDVGNILKIVGLTRTPFAVKGGGHTSNPGFSSTTGVHISMTRFAEVEYNHVTKTADVGMGLVWDDVYAALEPYNRTVVGGRVTGIGVAGFVLGGGYSYKTNQYGLSFDTVEAFRLVKPDGTVATVTHAADPELFFALKGSQNAFGIVTKITMQTVPQTAVWGGNVIYDMPELEKVNTATESFHRNVVDPKASLITTLGVYMNRPIASVMTFYDGPNPPPGIFDSFLSIPSLMSDLSTRSYLSLIQSTGVSPIPNPRVLFGALPHTDITPTFLQASLNELVTFASTLATGNDSYIGFAIEPFLSNILQHTDLPSAYPDNREKVYLPFNIYVAWTDPNLDSVYHEAVRGMSNRLRMAAISDGQDIPTDAPVYPNYALYDTPVEHIFGTNLPRLRALKEKVDPENVMGLAGGFKL